MSARYSITLLFLSTPYGQKPQQTISHPARGLTDIGLYAKINEIAAGHISTGEWEEVGGFVPGDGSLTGTITYYHDSGSMTYIYIVTKDAEV